MTADTIPGSHHGLITSHLVQLIESHSEGLAAGLLQRIHACGRCNDLLAKVPEHELKQRVFEIYNNLGQWIESASDKEIERFTRRSANAAPCRASR